MDEVSREEQRGLTRERLVGAALELVNQEGLDALSMRALADRLDVKAASLYWHVRDRRELVDLLAEAILDSVGGPRQRGTWRGMVLAIAEALHGRLAAQKDGNRILLEVPAALTRSAVIQQLASSLESAGLQPGEAAEVALLIAAQVIAGPSPADGTVTSPSGDPVSLAIDTGSRGVIVRAGPADMQALIRVPSGQSGAAPAVARGEQVVVRRLRGVGKGELELNPRHPWRFRVQAPTWNTVLDAGGLDVREVWIDSGAANVECFLPQPRGVVPVHLSSGVVNIAIHRPREAAVVAVVHTGAVKFRLDDTASKVAVFDVHWQTADAFGAPDRYELDVSSGVVGLTLDAYVPKTRPAQPPPSAPAAQRKPSTALEILLDGVEAHARSRS